MLNEHRFFHGDTIPLNVTGVVGFDGVSVTNLAGWAVRFTVKSSPISSIALVEKSTGAGSVTTSGGDAWWEISAAENRAAFEPGKTYVFDVQLTDPQGRVATPLHGTILILNDITKA